MWKKRFTESQQCCLERLAAVKDSLSVQIFVREAIQLRVELNWCRPLVNLEGVQLCHEVPIDLLDHLQG